MQHCFDEIKIFWLPSTLLMDPYHTEYIFSEHKNIFAYSVISVHWDDVIRWNNTWESYLTYLFQRHTLFIHPGRLSSHALDKFTLFLFFFSIEGEFQQLLLFVFANYSKCVFGLIAIQIGISNSRIWLNSGHNFFGAMMVTAPFMLYSVWQIMSDVFLRIIMWGQLQYSHRCF